MTTPDAPTPADLLGPPARAEDADDGATHAYPDDVETPEEHTGPGQQLQAGEG